MDKVCINFVGISSLVISLINAIYVFFIEPRTNRIRYSENGYIKTWNQIAESFSQYKILQNQNGTPQSEAKFLKVRIKADCEVLKYHIIKNRSRPDKERLIGAINIFMEQMTDEKFILMDKLSKAYIKSFND